ncbi:MAG: hypothetical protein KatS3mg081_0593 [Gemmatimonadales bacterium]|nr:MAG: hypothetical protein KatS3mg081_0593 [Gemmatimonadales bacterium]
MDTRKPLQVDAKAESGRFTARIWRINGPPDADGDIIAPGALPEQGIEVPVSLAQHDLLTNPDLAPAGRAQLFEDGGFGVAEGVTLPNRRGRQLRALLRAGGTEQQWSIGFRLLDWRDPTPEELARWPDARRVILKWQPVEISPVSVGACGEQCSTLEAKCGCGCGNDLAARWRAEKQKFLATVAEAEALDARYDLIRREIPAHRVPDSVRKMAEAALTLGAQLLGYAEQERLPRIRYFWPQPKDGKCAIGTAIKGFPLEIWVAPLREQVAETVGHELYHQTRWTAPEEAARLFGKVAAVLLQADEDDLLVGSRLGYADIRVPSIPGLASPPVIRGVSPGTLLAEPASGWLYSKGDGFNEWFPLGPYDLVQAARYARQRQRAA